MPLKLFKTAWHWVAHFHTAHWIWAHIVDSTITGTAIGWIAAELDRVPLSVAVLLGLLGFAAALLVLELFRKARQELAPEAGIRTAQPQAEELARPTLAANERSEVHIRNRDVRIHDLIVNEWRVGGRTFEDCVIHGPAVVGFLRCFLDERTVFEGAPGSIAIPPLNPNRYIRGTLLIKDCVFRRCTFRNIGVMNGLVLPAEDQQAQQSPQGSKRDP